MMYREEEVDTAFNESMHELQQQFLLCKERTSQKFQKLEELIEVAAHKLSLLMSFQDKQQEEGFSNSLNRKANTRRDRTLQQPGVIPDSVHHLELRLPKFEGAEVCKSLQDFEHQLVVEPLNDVEPMYDEEPWEGQECWSEQEFILAALYGGIVSVSDDPGEARYDVYPDETEDSGAIVVQTAHEVIRLSPSQLDDMIDRELYPYFEDKDGPLHECAKPGKFLMFQEETEVVLSQIKQLQEDPREGPKGWLEKEIISAVLRENNFHSSNLFQAELCTSMVCLQLNNPTAESLFGLVERYSRKENEGYKVPRLKVPIYIFDPGGKKLEEEGATMRAWLIFKRGGLSGNDPD